MSARPFRGGSIRSKLLAMVLLTTVVALGIADVAFIAYDRVAFERQRTNEIQTQAVVMGDVSVAALTFDDAEAAARYLAALRALPSVEEAVMYDAAGKVFATYLKEGLEARPAPPVGPEGVRIEDDELLLFHWIEKGGELVGAVHLRATLGARQRQASFGLIAAAVSAGALLVAMALVSRLQRFISQPIREVAEVARGVVENHDYSHRVVRRSDDEVGTLVDAFNQMLDGLVQREASLHATNQALQDEIAHHEAARVEVADLNRRLEQRVVERTAELEAANKELESFSYSVSHDLRAPLRSIDGFTLLLQERSDSGLDEQGRHYVERVRAATQRMGHLIDDLLKLSRTIRAEMVRRTVDLTALASQIAQELREAEPGRDVTVDVAPGLVAEADQDLTRAVLENLIGNAWKFTSRREDARIEVGRLPGEGPATFFVRDNGVGFDMKYANKLFGAFQRLHAVKDFEGSGIGLANVQRIVHRHGGRAWATSAPGTGATFYFTLAA